MRGLYIRTEASAQIGMGHFMRCFAVAETARDQGQSVIFLLNEISPPLLARLEAIGADHHLLATDIGAPEDITAMAGLLEPDATLMVDSYKVNAPYLEGLDATTRLMVFDDLAAHFLPCRMVINAASAALDMAYDRLAPTARRLIGPDYAPVRKEFRETIATGGSGITLIFGGSDAMGLSLKAAQAVLAAIDEPEVQIIAGPALRDLAALEGLSRSEPRLRVTQSPASLAEALKSTRIVITAAGTSVAEIATMGLMALVLVIADNQVAHIKTCPYPVRDARDGLPEDIGAWVRGFYQDRQSCEGIARKAKEIFDGQGCARILRAINSL